MALSTLALTRPELAEQITKLRDSMKDQIEQYITNLRENPAKAMRWGDGMYRYAATIHVCDEALSLLTHDSQIPLSAIRNIWRDQAENVLARTPSSTGIGQNEMDYSIARASYELLKKYEIFADEFATAE